MSPPPATLSAVPGHQDPIPVMRIDVRDEAQFAHEQEAVHALARRGAFTLGDEVQAFEHEFAAFCGSAHAVGVSSGTEALVLALRALDIGPGDEVIVPANSFIATAEAVSLVGATPALIDVDEDTAVMTPEGVAAAIGPRTRAVIPVHLCGATADVAGIVALTRRHDVAVIEDACQAHGARCGDRAAGTVGDLGCFSFYPTKNLGAWGDAGAVVTDDAALAARVQRLRSHGEAPGSRHHHDVVGTTARLDAVQAAVLRVRLRRLAVVTAERRRLGARLRGMVAGGPVRLPAAIGPGGDHVYHLFVVRCDARDDLREHLATHGVATAVHYPTPIHRTPAYGDLGLGEGSLPVVERLARRICTLPLWPGMGDPELERIAAGVASFTPVSRV
ncbi:MAG: DegT/DnrJ/EryC1/StrS family aminotransferase [Solirubrobacterales bacterium]|nr:DegT/DnrJ/EryC1/StrS family aminotransferase [Solirubrobacterales bacterium]